MVSHEQTHFEKQRRRKSIQNRIWMVGEEIVINIGREGAIAAGMAVWVWLVAFKFAFANPQEQQRVRRPTELRRRSQGETEMN